MFVLLGTTKGDADIRPETNALAVSHASGAIEAEMARFIALSDAALKAYPEAAYCTYVRFKIEDVPLVIIANSWISA